MPDATGEHLTAALLRALPPDLAEQLLGRMGPAGDRLRAAVAAPAVPPPEDLDAALAEFFDLHRILERGYVSTAVPAGEYGPLAKPTEAEPPPPEDPIESVKKLSIDRLVRALDGEPPSAVALVLGRLDPALAGTVLKGLPPEVRADIALRYSQPGPRNFALVNQIARVVAQKGNTLAEQPADAETDRIADLAAMLRGLPRPERLALLQKIEATDFDLAAKLKAKLFRFSDLLKLEDRPLQQLLSQLNLRSIATALKGADPAISEKILKNISARSRELLNEEVEMLGSISAARVQEGQDEILTLLRQYEEEGKIVLEE
jgi:flagellar motor switch protein FliG